MSELLKHIPEFSLSDAAGIFGNFYGLKGKAESLQSERDQNFKITESSGIEYVLKISNSLEEISLLDMQNQAMQFLNNNVYSNVCPHPVPAGDGKLISSITDKSGVSYFVRLLNFIPGKNISELNPLSNKDLTEVGSMYGSIDAAFLNFQHSASHRYFYWDIKHINDVSKYLENIDDIERRKIAEHFILQYNVFVRPKLSGLRSSVIHNDGNDNNILRRKISEINESFSIIDFGDMVHTYTINELAILTAYIIFNGKSPLETASQIIKGYNSNLQLTTTELEVLFYLIASRLTMSVCISAYQYSNNPDNEYLKISEQPAWDTLEKLIAVNPSTAEESFKDICNITYNSPNAGDSRLIDGRKKSLGSNLSVSYKKPLQIIRGFGQYLYDNRGNAYLDCVNNVCHVGHCHPKVVGAAQKQNSVLNTNTRYLHHNIIEYAERLTAKFPDKLNVCFFVCSGSEANELALRLAKNYTGRNDMIVVDHAYHGNTSSLIEISPYKYEGPGGRGKPKHVHKVNIPDVYRNPLNTDLKNPGVEYANEVKNLLEELESADVRPAGFIAESIAGVGGQIIFPPDYLSTVYNCIHDAGGICIADEVQVGFGRVGSHFWGFELQDVVPDIVTLGKPIGNGHPLGAVITTREIADAFNNGMEYFNTFGGNPVSCAIGLEVLDVIEEEKLQENSRDVGSYLLHELEHLKSKHELIGDVRGEGLFIGIELVKDRITKEPAADEASEIIEKMKEAFVLLSTDGPYHNVIKFKPPMVFNRQNADELVSKLHSALQL